MAVMTHAQKQADTSNYNHLDPDEQTRFDELMELADVTASNGEFLAYMLCAAWIAGIDLRLGQEIRKCGCSCWCPVIFKTRPDTHVIEESGGYNLGRVQCPRCTDEHLETA